jgi:hypothetical protein
MTRLARHSGRLWLPADTPLTPGTCNQEIALSLRSEELLVFSKLHLEREILFEQLSYPWSHIDTRSSSTVRNREKRRKQQLISEGR